MKDLGSDKVYYDSLAESVCKDKLSMFTGDPHHDFGEPTEEDLERLVTFFQQAWEKSEGSQ